MAHFTSQFHSSQCLTVLTVLHEQVLVNFQLHLCAFT